MHAKSGVYKLLPDGQQRKPDDCTAHAAMSEHLQLHAIISGRVQGVGFRFFAARCASRGPVTGRARNLFNGDVEVVAEGSKQALGEFLTELRAGPPGAWVKDVQAQWRAATGEYDDFRVAPTAYG